MTSGTVSSGPSIRDDMSVGTSILSGQPTPTPIPPDGRSYIFGLDVVRTTAILLVIASHMVKVAEPLGTIGVELFFVLSGYLVGGIFLRAILSYQANYGTMLLAFWRRRWARTVPNYFLFMILWLPVFPLDGTSWPEMLRYVIFAQNLWYPISPFFQISWSLAVEEWFYLIFPGLTTVLLLFTRKKIMATALIVAFIIIGCAIARLFPVIADFNRDMRMVVIYRLDALAVGVVGAMLLHVRPDLWRRCGCLWPVGLVMLTALSFVLARYNFVLTNIQATLLFSLLPIGTLFLVARSVSITEPPGIVRAIVQNISKWSYSMYLAHIPIFFLLYDLPGYQEFGSWMKFVVKIIGLVLIFGVSALVYRYFEVPMLERFSPRRVPH